jgi:hypothetical protein
MAAVGNDIPCASRSAAAVFFARMEVVMRRRGGGCVDEGNDDGGGDVVELAVTRAGFGRRDESGRGEAWTR